jgi:hypothetical protein
MDYFTQDCWMTFGKDLKKDYKKKGPFGPFEF